MDKDRLAAFTDGVAAVIITIMVLELKAPHEDGFSALVGLVPVFLSYVLSFTYVAIYWNNHHHLFGLVDRVDAAILWGNLHFLFWLSLIPFATEWAGDHHEASVPAAVYGGALLMPALAWLVLQRCIIRSQGAGSILARAVGRDVKGKISAAFYSLAILLAFVSPAIAYALYALVAVLWLVPDRRYAAARRRGREERVQGS